jgi:3-dehydroquinate synthetase
MNKKELIIEYYKTNNVAYWADNRYSKEYVAWLERKVLKLDQIQRVVLDEADEMLNMGFKEDIYNILSLLKFDKKNSHGKINFVLLEQIGKPIIDVQIPLELYQEAFAYYKEQ